MADIGALQPSRDVPGKIEHGMPLAGCGPEEWTARGILVAEAGDEIRPDLVVALADHRTEDGADLTAGGAEALHRVDRCLYNSGKRPAPAGMRRPDDAG